MIKIIDTYSQIFEVFERGIFSIGKWRQYINLIYANSSHIFEDDIKEYFDKGEYTFEKDFLPIINAVYKNPSLEQLHSSFKVVTNGLNEKVIENFGRELHVDLVLYLGLCNAAGWAREINGKNTVLLGVEKIIELNWRNINDLYGLIYHELGHIYHKQYGCLKQYSDNNKKNFVWQLFTEGIAMYFEQVLVNDLNYFHQDKKGWRSWCENHFQQILLDFNADLQMMARMDQRYFGDLADYYGRSDVGYFLGTKFVHYLCEKHSFEQLINMKLDDIYDEYLVFVEIQ